VAVPGATAYGRTINIAISIGIEPEPLGRFLRSAEGFRGPDCEAVHVRAVEPRHVDHGDDIRSEDPPQGFVQRHPNGLKDLGANDFPLASLFGVAVHDVEQLILFTHHAEPVP